MYVDAQFMHQLWEELYDTNLKLWKVARVHLHPAEMDSTESVVPLDGSSIETYWDIQNGHLTHLFTANRDGKTDGVTYNQKAPKEYDNITKYSTPGGLMQIMR
jgi:hypothetical protein